MRLLLAGVVAVAAFALAAPSFAQSEESSGGAATPAPAPIAKPAKGTAAYCQTLKSSSHRKSCLQKLHAQAQPKDKDKDKTTTVAKKKKKPATPNPSAAPGDSAQYTPPAAAAPATGSTSGPVPVPPLPQKTI